MGWKFKRFLLHHVGKCYIMWEYVIQCGYIVYYVRESIIWYENMSHNVVICRIMWVVSHNVDMSICHIMWVVSHNVDMSICHIMWVHVIYCGYMSYNVGICHILWVVSYNVDMSIYHIMWVHVIWRNYTTHILLLCLYFLQAEAENLNMSEHKWFVQKAEKRLMAMCGVESS
jgi:hypothetical protein